MNDCIKPMMRPVCEAEADVNERLDRIDQIWCSTVSAICDNCDSRTVSACNTPGAVCLLEDAAAALLAAALEVDK